MTCYELYDPLPTSKPRLKWSQAIFNAAHVRLRFPYAVYYPCSIPDCFALILLLLAFVLSVLFFLDP